MSNLGLDAYAIQLKKRLAAMTEEVSKAATPMTSSQLGGTTTRPGIFTRDLPDAFIDLVVDESVLLKNIRLERKTEPTGEIAKIDVVGHISEQASENTTSTETRSITPSTLEYLTRKIRSQFDITTEVEEDNIEGPSGMNTMVQAMMKAISNDFETLALEGDESQGGASDYARLVKTNDGFQVLTAAGTGAHQVNAGNKRISWKLLHQMLKTLPTKFRGNLQNFRWIASSNTVLDLLEEAESRQTGLGDLKYNSRGELTPLGIQFLEVPRLPEDLSASGTDSTGTFIWLCDPRNFIYIVQRQMTVHKEFKPRTDKWEYTVFTRNDFLVENTDGVVRANNVLLDPSADRYTG